MNRVDTDETSEKKVIARINRYSTLRAAERAIEPSVRGRRDLPTATVGRDLLVELRKTSQIIRDSENGEPPEALQMFDGIDHTLTEFAFLLRQIISRTPMIQLRTTLPSIAEQFRVEAIALLEVSLEGDDIDDCPMLLIDFLITLLSSSQGVGVKSMSADPCTICPTVERLSSEWNTQRNSQAEDEALEFRNAAVETLQLDDLEPMVKRMRKRKRTLRYRYFHPELLRSIVGYNLAVANRFKAVLNQSRARGQLLDDALGSLRALDEPDPETERADG